MRPKRRRSRCRSRRSRRRPSSGRCRARDIAILKPSPGSPISASSPTSTSSRASEAVSEERRPSLPWISWDEKPGVVGGDEEAGEAAVLGLGVGLGEDERHLGMVAERDPHLLAVDAPAARRCARPGSGGWPRRSRCRARSGRSSRTTRPSRASAASGASAPPIPQRSIEPATSEVWTETTVRAALEARSTCSSTSA